LAKHLEAQIVEQIKLVYNEYQVEKYVGTDNSGTNYIKKELENKYGENEVIVKNYSDNGYYINIQDVGVYTIDNGITRKSEEKVFATDILEEGDYVYYLDANNNKVMCRVLYDKTSDYGVQIITQNTVGTAILGKDDETINTNLALNTNFTLNNVSIDDDFKKTVYSYNNGVDTLNKLALSYRDSKFFSSARCVGSDPKNFYAEKPLTICSVASTNSDNEEWSFSGEFKREDNNYRTDVTQMNNLGILGSDHNYFLCSRKERVYTYGFSFGFRTVRYRNNTYEDYYGYFIMDYSGYPAGSNRTDGFRPVFILWEGTTIDNNNKDGKSETSAYELTYIH